MAITKVIKTCIKLVADNQQDFEATVNKLQQILDLSEAEKMAVLEESLTIIVNTDIQTEIDALNALSQAMLDAEKSEQSKALYLHSTEEKGRRAFLKWRSMAFDFLFAKKQALEADSTSTLYADITNTDLMNTYQNYLFFFYIGMIPELIAAVTALPANSLMLKEFYPIGQTTTTVKDHYLEFLNAL